MWCYSKVLAPPLPRWKFGNPCLSSKRDKVSYFTASYSYISIMWSRVLSDHPGRTLVFCQRAFTGLCHILGNVLFFCAAYWNFSFSVLYYSVCAAVLSLAVLHLNGLLIVVRETWIFLYKWVCHWSYILSSAWRFLCPCAQLLSLPVRSFTYVLQLLLPIVKHGLNWGIQWWLELSEEVWVGSQRKSRKSFTLRFQPCFGHSVLCQEKSLYSAHGYLHSISLVGLEAGSRILHFLLQFRAVHCLICFVRSSQDPDLTVQIRVLISHLHSLIFFKGKKKYMIAFRWMFFCLCIFKVDLTWKTLVCIVVSGTLSQ